MMMMTEIRLLQGKKGFSSKKGRIMLKFSKTTQVLLSALIVAIITEIVSGNDLNELTLEITPSHRKHLEVGKGIQFECQPSEEKRNITWLLPNGTRVQMSEERRIYQTSRILQIKEATINDSGVYTCLIEQTLHNTTVHLIVYVMPTFYFESMIIVGVNCFLIFLFFLCYLYTIVYRRWRTKNKAGKVNNPSEKEKFGPKC